MTARNPVRLVSAEPLRVEAALVGRRLASPARRGVALALDAALVAVLSSASGAWLALALLLLAWQVGRSMVHEGVRPGLGLAVAAVLALGAVAAAWNAGSGDAVPSPAVRTTVGVAPAGPSSAASAGSAATAAASSVSNAVATDVGDRVAVLESELARLREAQAEVPALHERLERLADDLGLSFGWAIVYFTLLPAFWSGQTVGKRLLGLRIVALSGEPITPLRSLKRYGGYAAGLATGGLGFLQVLWDPNRQGLQDKAAHTVVVDERALPAPPA